jgi:hypothetical protein
MPKKLPALETLHDSLGKISPEKLERIKGLADALNARFQMLASQKSDNPKERERFVFSRRAAALVSLVEMEIPVLSHDIHGWEGNLLVVKGYVDPAIAPQRGCLHEAEATRDILEFLQTKNLIPKEYMFQTETINEIIEKQPIYHVGVRINNAKDKNADVILDTWQMRTGETGMTYTGDAAGKGKWAKDVHSQYLAFDNKIKAFGKLIRDPKTHFVEDYSAEKDFILLQFFAREDSALRTAIDPVFVLLIKKQLSHSLPEQKLAIGKTKNITGLQPYIREYFLKFYAASDDVQKIFKKGDTAK